MAGTLKVRGKNSIKKSQPLAGLGIFFDFVDFYILAFRYYHYISFPENCQLHTTLLLIENTLPKAAILHTLQLLLCVCELFLGVC